MNFIQSILGSCTRAPEEESRKSVRMSVNPNYTKHVLICGMGNAAHAYTATLTHAGADVRIYESMGQAQVDKFNAGMEANGGKLEATMLDGNVLSGTPSVVTCDPEEATKGLTSDDIIILPIPSFAIPPVLTKLVPSLPKGILVVTMPGPAGLDWAVHELLGKLGRTDIVMAGSDTIPFACRTTEFGAKVSCPGLKRWIKLAADPPSAGAAVAQKLTTLFNGVRQQVEGSDETFSTQFDYVANFLCITIQPANQITHPPIMRSLVQRQPKYDVAPEFYWSLDEPTEQVILGLEDETFAIADALDKKQPSMNMRKSLTTSIHDLVLWYKDSIPEDKRDRLLTCYAANEVYKGMAAPVVPSPDGEGVIIDVTSRYLTEDIPQSLMLLRTIGELCEVDTPVMDDLIVWAQGQMNKEYLVPDESGKLVCQGKDMADCPVPSKFGFDTLDKLLELYK